MEGLAWTGARDRKTRVFFLGNVVRCKPSTDDAGEGQRKRGNEETRKGETRKQDTRKDENEMGQTRDPFVMAAELGKMGRGASLGEHSCFLSSRAGFNATDASQSHTEGGCSGLAEVNTGVQREQAPGKRGRKRDQTKWTWHGSQCAAPCSCASTLGNPRPSAALVREHGEKRRWLKVRKRRGAATNSRGLSSEERKLERAERKRREKRGWTGMFPVLVPGCLGVVFLSCIPGWAQRLCYGRAHQLCGLRVLEEQRLVPGRRTGRPENGGQGGNADGTVDVAGTALGLASVVAAGRTTGAKTRRRRRAAERATYPKKTRRLSSASSVLRLRVMQAGPLVA